MSAAMAALIFLLLNLGASFFKSKRRLEAENAALRQQLIVLQCKVRGRVQFTNGDRLFFIQLYRWFPSVLKAILIIRPETLVRWHRAGFRRYWRWKSRNLGGRPQISPDLRSLIIGSLAMRNSKPRTGCKPTAVRTKSTPSRQPSRCPSWNSSPRGSRHCPQLAAARAASAFATRSSVSLRKATPRAITAGSLP
jgi:hypothetical protein